ncbi:hypothetical protein GCM10027435_13630 [Haloparvum alkalitolerans]|uniref:hypothetical protein n=1 Tax=Haloparvum alkalitolerans TaxID=1042953 RepID=UPI003CF4841A
MATTGDDQDVGGDDGFIEGAETEILEQYADGNWGVVNDLVDEAEPTNLEGVECTKRIHRTLAVDDEDRFIELAPNEAQRTDVQSEFMDVHAADRDSFVPDEFESLELDFPIPESERVDVCTNCDGNGRNRCTNCDGSGANRCGRCNGSGTNSDQSATCSKCGGSGTVVCDSCSGNGSTTCGTCDGTGETYKMDFVRRTYDPTETVEVETDRTPDKYVEDAEGQKITTEKNAPADDEIRNETEIREVPVSILDYEYDGDEYTVYHVDGEPRARSYPKSTTRKVLPFAVVGIGVVVAALWYFNII